MGIASAKNGHHSPNMCIVGLPVSYLGECHQNHLNRSGVPTGCYAAAVFFQVNLTPNSTVKTDSWRWSARVAHRPQPTSLDISGLWIWQTDPIF